LAIDNRAAAVNIKIFSRFEIVRARVRRRIKCGGRRSGCWTTMWIIVSELLHLGRAHIFESVRLHDQAKAVGGRAAKNLLREFERRRQKLI